MSEELAEELQNDASTEEVVGVAQPSPPQHQNHKEKAHHRAPPEHPTVHSSRKKLPTITRPRVYLTFAHNPEAPQNVLPGSLRIHPRGFRLLKGSSPLERRMNTYFRLPPRPSKNMFEEQRKVLREVAKALPPRGSSHFGTHRVTLDGFILLEACGVQDPSEAKECVLNDSNLCSSAEEDLPYFSNLRFLDLGENLLELADLRLIPSLEEVHLHCNGITTLRLEKPKQAKKAGDDDDLDDYVDISECFTRLSTLNLSFNCIPYQELTNLTQLHALERLDLSSNNLRHLPADLSGLVNVAQLALENNKFSDPSVLLALSTMPNLLEVNLNFNQFTSVPRLSVDEGQGLCFPLLQVIGLASNNIEFFEDVYALTQLSTLRRVVLWGNPVERKMKDCEILIYEFGARNVQIVLESPIPPKRKVGEFYSANTQNFVKVSEKDLRPIPKKGVAIRKPHTAPAAMPSDGEGGNQPGGPSFFVTQVGIENQTEEDAGIEDQQGPADNSRAGAQRGRAHNTTAMDDSWFSGTPRDAEPPNSGTGGGGRRGETQRVDSREGSNMDFPRSGLSVPPLNDGTDWGTQGNARDEMCKPNANVRSVMAELKRMLRQPLPPIHVPQFEQSTVSRNLKKR